MSRQSYKNARGQSRAQNAARQREQPLPMMVAVRLVYQVHGREPTERALREVYNLDDERVCSIIQHIETSLT